MSGKIYRYALFYFPQTNEVGTARTTAISEGYRCQVTVGSVVKVRWENESEEVPAKILQMDGMDFFFTVKGTRFNKKIV